MSNPPTRRNDPASDRAKTAVAAAADVGPLLTQACEYLPHGVAVADAAFRILYSSKRFDALFARRDENAEPSALGSILKASLGGAKDNDALGSLMQRIADGASVSVSVNGRPILLTSRALPNGCYLLTAEAPTEPPQLLGNLDMLASRDPLTGLPNRLVLRQRIAEALRGVEDATAGAAVLCLDLDRFKNVNDTLGHPVGDLLLKRVTDRLLSAIGPHDVLARFGGDEFAILLGSGDQAAAELLAGRLVDLVGRAYLLEDHIVNVGVSIGIAIAPRDGADADTLIKCADLALYRAKEGGRGCFRVYQPEMQTRAKTRRALEFDLRKALGLREFELFYQPQVDLGRNRVEGFEALLRWRHPTRGLVSPADFIPIVEELGLIIPIGEWVIRTACAEAATWPEHMTVAVNLSAVQFTSPRLVTAVAAALAASKLAPHRLELEITESVLLTDTAGAVAMLHQLRAMGVRISMDDFGTGYSSLSYLRSFPFDKIKIDQSFVRGMDNSRDCVAIVRAIAGLANALGICTTAEGVETDDQRERVRLEGCTSIQGYLISKPLPASDIRPLLSLVASAA